MSAGMVRVCALNYVKPGLASGGAALGFDACETARITLFEFVSLAALRGLQVFGQLAFFKDLHGLAFFRRLGQIASRVLAACS